MQLLNSNCVVGFYFTFEDKFHPGARAYFCKVGDLHRRLRPICPLRHLLILLQMTQKDLFFQQSELTRDVLTNTMKNTVCIENNVKPHSLRIGGHTYYTVYWLGPGFQICFSTIKDLPIWFFSNNGIFLSQNSYGYKTHLYSFRAIFGPKLTQFDLTLEIIIRNRSKVP